jgi:succinate dehydrogenase flavin-adding protein (antitoxin of CptAB toxin-antitoxin module)
MLELDLLLLGFLEHDWAALEESERRSFERLLGHPDALLWEYLMGYAEAVDPEIAHVVSRIRQYAAH